MLYNNEKYKDCQSSLKDTSESKDDNNNKEYLTNINITVTNFDKVAGNFASYNHIDTPASVDALYEYGTSYCFVEFKNTRVSPFDVAHKLYDSVIILSHIYKISMLAIKEKCIYIVVYNKEKNKDINKTSEKKNSS